MKALLFVLILLLSFSLSYSQDYLLWLGDYSADDAGSTDSRQVNLTDEAEELGKFNGLFAVTLDLDTLAADQGGDDTLYFCPMYKVSGTWFIGDTIQWDRLNTADYHIDDAFINTNIEAVIAQTYQDSILVWVIDPTSTTDIEGYPIWQEVGMRMLHGDSVDVNLEVRMGRH